MTNYDMEKAKRVWQRVQATQMSGCSEPEDTQAADLLRLIAGEWADAVTYLQLSRKCQGRQATLLRKLFEEEQSHMACLKGIYTLITGQKPVVQATPPTQEPMALALRKCYGREMHCLAEYEAKAAHPEYGPVFARLAQQEREHCRLVLELLGNVGKGR